MLHGRENFSEKKLEVLFYFLPELREVVSLNAYKEQRRAIKKKKKKKSNISQKKY